MDRHVIVYFELHVVIPISFRKTYTPSVSSLGICDGHLSPKIWVVRDDQTGITNSRACCYFASCKPWYGKFYFIFGQSIGLLDGGNGRSDCNHWGASLHRSSSTLAYARRTPMQPAPVHPYIPLDQIICFKQNIQFWDNDVYLIGIEQEVSELKKNTKVLCVLVPHHKTLFFFLFSKTGGKRNKDGGLFIIKVFN